MKHVNARELARALERKGWTLERVTEGHFIYNRPGARRPIPVPKHGARTLRTGTQRAIMREAGLTDADL
jgi:predicted RNA binding protein YcfA (HicA-like mRNA interferase family)